MKFYDISWPLSHLTTEYKNKKTLSFKQAKTFEKDGVRDSIICLGTHSGTHVDAPSHFLKDGKTIDQITLDRLIGRAVVLDFPADIQSISADDLGAYELKANDIVLLRTANSALSATGPFEKNFVFLTASGARYLIEKKINAVGIDYLGIERGDPDHTTHSTLMQADITIIEGLRLAHVNPGTYFMVCLPIALVGLEAAPARAILMADH